MKAFLWALAVCGSILGGIVSVAGVLAAKGAPQEAAAAAIGVACAVIPYCLARAVSEISHSTIPASLVATIAENVIAIRKNTSQVSSEVTERRINPEQSSSAILPKIRT